MNRHTPKRLGEKGEQLARQFLQERGCSTVATNVHADGGEIDLIVRDGRHVVAVEVKTSADGIDPIEAVDDHKFGMVARTVASLPHAISRIDIVGIAVGDDSVVIRWLRGID